MAVTGTFVLVLVLEQALGGLWTIDEVVGGGLGLLGVELLPGTGTTGTGIGRGAVEGLLEPARLLLLEERVGVLEVSLEMIPAALVMAEVEVGSGVGALETRGGVEAAEVSLLRSADRLLSLSGSRSILSQGQTSSKLDWLLGNQETFT